MESTLTQPLSLRGKGIFAIFAVALILSCPMIIAYDEDVEETDAIAPVVMGIALLVSFIAGAGTYHFIDNWGDGHVPDGADQGEINAEFRKAQAELISSNYGTASGMWSKLANNDAMLWPFLESYFNLQAETSASYLWKKDGQYNGDKILEMSSTLSNSMIYNYNLTNAWNEFSDSWSNYRTLWNEKGSAYDSMQLAFTWGSTIWTSDSGRFGADLMKFVTPSDGLDRIYIDIIGDEEQGYSDRSNIMTSVGPGKITSTTTGRTWELQSGENDLGKMGVYSGWYELSTGATYIAQNIAGSVSKDGLMPSACILMHNGDEYAYAYMKGNYPSIVRNGQSIIEDGISMTVSYDDRDGTKVTKTVDIQRILEAYDTVVKAMNSAAITANNAGLTAWTVFNKIDTSSTLIKPSSITSGTQGNTNLTPQQASVMYLSAMNQLSKLGSDVTSDGITISPDSLNLICYGDIYHGGVMIAKNVVYTPFVYSDARIPVGVEDLDVNGVAMVWATEVPSVSDWDGKTDNSAIIDITGAKLDTRNIIYDGTEVSYMDLEVDSMERLGLIGYDAPKPPTPPKTVDVVPLIQAIVILIGAIVAVIGLGTRSPWIIIAGIVIAIAGYFLAGWVVGKIL